MKVIKIKFEYGCFPVWIYGEDNELIENDLPPYLINYPFGSWQPICCKGI